MTELSCGDLTVMFVAQVAGVVVVVGPAKGQRHDVIDDGRLGRPPSGGAHLA